MNESLAIKDKVSSRIEESRYISRDLSWIQFNYRVLDQVKNTSRGIFDRLKFLAITYSNLDEFCTIRLGSLYNYIDYGKERYDYSGLREEPFRKLLLNAIRNFVQDQHEYFIYKLKPLFRENGFQFASYEDLTVEQTKEVNRYFDQTIFPMLTPMAFDSYHTFPVLKNNRLLFGVVTEVTGDGQNQNRVSFIQVPSNIPRFYEVPVDDCLLFVPVEEIIKKNLSYYLQIPAFSKVNKQTRQKVRSQQGTS